MRVAGFILLLISAILAPAASAQDLVIPDRQRLQAMSQEEYGAYRDQIRRRMMEQGQPEQNLMPAPLNADRGQMGKWNNGYGQGYGNRTHEAGSPPGMSGGMAGGGHQGGYGRGGGRRR